MAGDEVSAGVACSAALITPQRLQRIDAALCATASSLRSAEQQHHAARRFDLCMLGARMKARLAAAQSLQAAAAARALLGGGCVAWHGWVDKVEDLRATHRRERDALDQSIEEERLRREADAEAGVDGRLLDLEEEEEEEVCDAASSAAPLPASRSGNGAKAAADAGAAHRESAHAVSPATVIYTPSSELSELLRARMLLAGGVLGRIAVDAEGEHPTQRGVAHNDT
jgi:hypothetical protein